MPSWLAVSALIWAPFAQKNHVASWQIGDELGAAGLQLLPGWHLDVVVVDFHLSFCI